MIIKSNSSAQLSTIGGVQVTTTLCASDTSNPSNNSGYSPADPTCQKFATGGNANAGGNSGSDASNNTNTQVTVAYRIPSTATAPSTITSTNATCNNNITFNQSASLASAIQNLSAAGSGKQWVAYISAGQNYTTAGCQYITVAPTFTLQQGSDGSPFQGPFN
ncbi:MAG: hypothetical protein M3O76_00850, partial [Actinomycetota bacterium]|nr:hypothetical protein [Actinomycetota bacterium]